MDLQLIYTDEYWKESSCEDGNLTPNKSTLRKIKTLQGDLHQLTEDLSISERARRTAEFERNELQEEITQFVNKETQITNEKRRLEARISTLEEELEEEQNRNEQSLERTRKSQMYSQQLSVELANERSTTARLESFLAQFERQNKDLKEKYAEQEVTQRAKIKAIAAEFESKIANLEEQLDSEEKERLEQQRANRKLDKKIKMLTMQVEDDQRRSTLHQEQLERAHGRINSLKQHLDEAEDETFREKAEKRRLQKECADLMVCHESLLREISILKLSRQDMNAVVPPLRRSLSPRSDKGSGDNPELDNTKSTDLSYLSISQ